jgi:hypothetical protein
MARFWFLVGVLLTGSACGQNTHKGSGYGQVVVTATVSGSVALMIAPNGEPRIIVANAPADQALLASVAVPKATGPADMRATSSHPASASPIRGRAAAKERQ